MSNNLKDYLKNGSEEAILLKKIDKKKMPIHVAIIMDGNGRWAKKMSLKREEGHREGAKSALEITECAARIGIKYLTVFAFSSENWKRSIKEVTTLMKMLYENLVEQKRLLIENNIKLKIIGNIERLPVKLKNELKRSMELSKFHNGMQINLALNYGSRMEILNATKKILEEKISPFKVNEELFKRYLNTYDSPDPDLLIRTSGELRISNFLLYQIAYSELYFTKTLWPDFKTKEFLEAIVDFQQRERRFGRV